MLTSFRKIMCAAVLCCTAMGCLGAGESHARAADRCAVEPGRLDGLVLAQYYDSSSNSLKDWFVGWFDGQYHHERTNSQADALAKFNDEKSQGHSTVYGYNSEFEGQVLLGRYQGHR